LLIVEAHNLRAKGALDPLDIAQANERRANRGGLGVVDACRPRSSRVSDEQLARTQVSSL
jgi:hypothetical protein